MFGIVIGSLGLAFMLAGMCLVYKVVTDEDGDLRWHDVALVVGGAIMFVSGFGG